MLRTPSKDAGVFICWSGPRSLDLAKRLCGLLERVVPELKGRIFISTQIEKGARWFDEIATRLESARAGILCLTPENLAAPWLHFEAGALAKGLQASAGADSQPASPAHAKNRIFTYLHGVSPASLRGPFEHYQSATTTREDTSGLIAALVSALQLDDRTDRSGDFQAAWPAFERDVRRIEMNVYELVPEFEGWFRRKTFDEPVQECTDQSWIARYDGARQTVDRLTSRVDAVRRACPRYQVDLYQHLVAAVDAYAMTIRGLLLGREPFPLGDDGELEIDPGIRRACENRRAHVKDVVSRILDPVAVARTEEAACFWVTDSFEQRKLLVHRLEHRLLRVKRRSEAQPTGDGALANVSPDDRELPLTGKVDADSAADAPRQEELEELFDSAWDLDRIFGYLAAEHLHASAQDGIGRLSTAVRMELERVRARRERPTLMPLHYALGALQKALEAALRSRELQGDDRARVTTLCVDTHDLIDNSRSTDGGEPTLDRNGQVRRTIREIQTLLGVERKAGFQGDTGLDREVAREHGERPPAT
jgi:hypothetical protein